MFTQIKLYIYLAVVLAFAGVAGFGYWQYRANLASSAKNAQLEQALANQKAVVDDLTKQAAEIAAKHKQLNDKFRAAEDQLQDNLNLPDAKEGEDDTAINTIGRQIERRTR